MAIKHLSHSTAEDWATCSLKVYLRKLKHVTERPSWALLGGGRVHSVTEYLDLEDFGIPAERGEYDLTDPSGDFAESWEESVAALEEKSGFGRDEWTTAGRASKEFPDKEGYRFWLTEGPKMVANWRRFLRDSSWQIFMLPSGYPAVEIGIEGLLGDVPVKGFIDRILEDTRTGQLVVNDIKSGKSRPKSAGQLALYKNFLNRAHEGEFQIRYGNFYMVRDGVLTEAIDLDEIDDGRLEYRYKQAWRGITEGIFFATPNMLCGSCSVRDYCYENPDAQHADSVLPYRKKVS